MPDSYAGNALFWLRTTTNQILDCFSGIDGRRATGSPAQRTVNTHCPQFETVK
jgi:hypothetical protein